MPSLNISFTITAIIALVSLISPLLVSIINNIFLLKNKQIDLNNNINIEISKTYFLEKTKAFSLFLNNAGKYCSNYWNPEYHILMQSSLKNAMLFCETEEATKQLNAFSIYINDKFSTLRNDNKNINDILELSNKIATLSIVLNKELLITKSIK